MARDSHSPIHAQPEPPSQPSTGLPSAAPPFLSLHTTVVLLVAAFFGVVMGGLPFLSEKSVPKAVAAGLTTATVSTPVLHKLIG
ncbi:hypothetical protein [Streptomyces mirabilis]|uniref:hypothetical protein n=1 Tax=Streptomyces mirabilis TaxID=68239 RepID=UPI0036C4D03C